MYSVMKQDVLAHAQRAFKNKLFTGTSGNLSVFNREDNVMAITPSGVRYESMKVEDIVIVSSTGDVIEGHHNPSSEMEMHLEVYEQLEEVNALVHTHSPFATAFAVVNKVIPLILIEMVPFLNGEIHVASYETPGTRELGRSICKVLQNAPAALMQNHGAVTVGSSLQEAYIRSEYVEDAAKIYHHALQIGEPNVLTIEDIDAWKKNW